jgi:hypothetical protein
LVVDCFLLISISPKNWEKIVGSLLQIWKYVQCNKKKKKYHTLGTVPKSSEKILHTVAKSISLTHIHGSSLSWHGTGTSMKNVEVTLVL